MKMMFLALFLLLPLLLSSQEESGALPPKYLYKITSIQNWRDSQKGTVLVPQVMDEAFIHLATEAQIGSVINKYWSEAPEIVLLKIDTSLLKGELKCERNPGGTHYYYHLYGAEIPHRAIIESKILRREESGGYLNY
jgi:uncharacterized protein (DUF952 family)